jgi:hypothetical protein
MSRYTIEALRPGLTVDVGWDNPLRTFFAQVSRQHADNDPDDEADPFILWLGGTPREVPTPEALAAGLAGYAVIPADLIRALHRDRAASADRPPTAFQEAMLRAVGRSQ